MKTHNIFILDWIESEAGWGAKLDNYSFHKTFEDAVAFQKKHSKGSPEYYWRAENCRRQEVSDKIFKKIKGDGIFVSIAEFKKMKSVLS